MGKNNLIFSSFLLLSSINPSISIRYVEQTRLNHHKDDLKSCSVYIFPYHGSMPTWDKWRWLNFIFTCFCITESLRKKYIDVSMMLLQAVNYERILDACRAPLHFLYWRLFQRDVLLCMHSRWEMRLLNKEERSMRTDSYKSLIEWACAFICLAPTKSSTHCLPSRCDWILQPNRSAGK